MCHSCIVNIWMDEWNSACSLHLDVCLASLQIHKEAEKRVSFCPFPFLNDLVLKTLMCVEKRLRDWWTELQIESPFLDPSQGNPPTIYPLGAQPVAGDPAEEREWAGPQAQAVSQGNSTPDPDPQECREAGWSPKTAKGLPLLSPAAPECGLRISGFIWFRRGSGRWVLQLLEIFYLCCTSSDILGLGWWVGRSAWESSLMHMLVQGDWLILVCLRLSCL